MTSLPTQLNHKDILLPFKNKVIFVDWHGVISNENFWHNKSKSENHYLNKIATEISERVFSDDIIIEKWLRGEIDYQQIIHDFHSESSKHTKLKIANRLLKYFHEIELNIKLLKTLSEYRNEAFIVMATDNMDCFFKSLPDFKYLGLFDSVLSSNKLGVLKKEDPDVFFGEWLSAHSLNFSNAILIDDSIANCNRFTEKGGHAINYTIGSKINLKNKLKEWFTFSNQESLIA
ncbi:MAG: hypothetical protein ACK5M1_04755 [Xanthomarina gelatinilytica]|uniref:hypothetical protein n=1 Tax=Xanthomarina gelatinilytica TaxID=1137281 RepID=UPI003A8A29B6